MIAIMVAMFFSSINQTIVGVAMPRIIAKLNGMDHYTWVLTIYLLTSTIATILVGKLSDIYGRKYFILTGIVIFMAGAFLCGTAQDMLHLIAYRGLQGTGAGIIMSTAFTAVGDLFSPRERGRWSGIMSAVFGVSSVLGPGLGGYIVDHLDWHWVFWLFLPLGFIAFFLILFLFPRSQRQEAQSIDYLGSLFLTLTIVPMLLAFSWAGTKYAWISAPVMTLLGCTATALGIFIFVETRARTPVLPLSLFKNSVISISNAAGFLMNAAMMGALMYMPFFIQGVMGVSATYAGYVTMPMSLAMFALNAYAGNRMTRTGRYKKMALAGFAAMIAGMFLMSMMNSLPVAVVSMIVFGCGLGLAMPVLMIAVQNVVDNSDLGVATASVQLFRNLGGTIGIAVMGTILSSSIAAKINNLGAGMDQFNNPQILLDPARLAAIQNSFPESQHPAFIQMVDYLRQALASSLAHVFLAGTALMVIALALTFFLKEIPLRTTVHKAESAKPAPKPMVPDRSH